jgi:uncharacterized protein (TIGR02466 family)
MSLQNLFSIAISEEQFAVTNKQQCMDSILWETTKKSEDDYFIQSVDKELHKTAPFQLLKETVEFRASCYWQKLGYVRRNFVVTQMWANAMKGAGTIHTHFHSNSLVSGVFYLDVDSEDSGGTVFYNPLFGLDRLIAIPEESDTVHNRMDYLCLPKNDKLILFPSFLQHRSQKNCGTKERITISFNLLPETLGSHNHINYVDLRR